MKILVLEDEIGIRSFVSINLKREGYEIIEAGTGAEAIEKINENNDISIALLDVMLPDMSGIEVCKYIRQKFDQVGIIMLTAKSNTPIADIKRIGFTLSDVIPSIANESIFFNGYFDSPAKRSCLS